MQDEVITDLLRPASRGLTVSVNAEVGILIPGLHKEPVKDEMSLRRLLLEACDNRASHTLPPGASIDTSSAVFEISIKQSESSTDSDIVQICTSRMLIVDVPSVDPLMQKNGQLNLMDGPTLHKQLVTFVDVVKRLSSPDRAALAPFRSSKFTNYFSELLGGNAIVVGLGILVPGEPANSKLTMGIMSALTHAHHFPVGGREYSGVLQGLLAKYRSLILQLQDEIENGAPVGDKPAPTAVTEKIVSSLQSELAKAVLDRNTALADTARLYEMMELLKTKYNTLLEEKTKQSRDLIRSEEEKMAISRALVELKLEHSQHKEQ